MCRKLLFTVLLLSACSPLVYAQGWQSAPERLTLSETQRANIQRLIAELQTINADLSSDLTSCQTDLQALRQSLKAADQRFQTVSAQLMALQTESTALRQELQTARESLTILEGIFNEYKKKAMDRAAALEAQRNIAAGAGIGGIIIAFIIGAIIF